jgi:hypothetical protein
VCWTSKKRRLAPPQPKALRAKWDTTFTVAYPYQRYERRYNQSVEMIARTAILLALLGPLLTGIAVPITSGLLLRRLSRRQSPSDVRAEVRPAVVAGALLLWVALSVGTAVFLISFASITAMGWADSRTWTPIREQLELLAIVSGGMLLLIGCGIVLHRVLIRTCRVVLNAGMFD